MKNKSSVWIIVLAVVVIAAVILATNRPINVYSTQDQVRKISVSADADIEVSPDEAQILLSVDTLRSSAKEAQDENARQAEQIINALEQAGVDKDDIETISYRIYPQQDWDPQTRTYKDKGFEVQHTLKITTKKLDDVGELLQVSVNAGANRVQNIQFSLSDEQQETLKEQLLKTASEKAHSKAQSLAKNLGASIGKVLSANENSYSYAPYRYGAVSAAMAVTEESAAPPISPQDVSVSVSVSVVYELV